MHYHFWFFDNNNNNIQGPKKRPRKVYQYMNVTQSWVLSKRACGVRSSRILREEEEEEEVTMRRGTFHARPQHQWRFFREIDIFHGENFTKKCGHKSLIITKVICVDFAWEEKEEEEEVWKYYCWYMAAYFFIVTSMYFFFRSDNWPQLVYAPLNGLFRMTNLALQLLN